MKIKRQESQKTEVSVSFCRAKKQVISLCLTKKNCRNAYNQSHSESLQGVYEMVLYLDLFFLFNLVMDLTALLLGEQIGRWSGIPEGKWNFKKLLRMTAASGFGAVWACAAVCTNLLPVWAEQIITLVVVSTGMILISSGYQGWRLLLGKVFSLLASAVLIAGVLSLFSSGRMDTGRQTGSSAGLVIAAGAGMTIACLGLGRFLGRSIAKNRLFYEVTLRYRGREKTVRALWDTGNRLREPYGNQPVHVVEARACRGFCEKISGVIYIPFCCVGRSQGWIPGIRMDEMEVKKSGQVIASISRPWIAISRETLSPDGKYQMLLNEEKK